jgi:hypothetical protein
MKNLKGKKILDRKFFKKKKCKVLQEDHRSIRSPNLSKGKLMISLNGKIPKIKSVKERFRERLKKSNSRYNNCNHIE